METQAPINKMTPITPKSGFMASSLGIAIIGTFAALAGPFSPPAVAAFAAVALAGGAFWENRRPGTWAFAPAHAAGWIVLAGCAFAGMIV